MSFFYSKKGHPQKVKMKKVKKEVKKDTHKKEKKGEKKGHPQKRRKKGTPTNISSDKSGCPFFTKKGSKKV